MSTAYIDLSYTPLSSKILSHFCPNAIFNQKTAHFELHFSLYFFFIFIN